MKITTKVTELEKEDYYQVEIKNYKQTISGKFSREELRNHIEIIDNAIKVGLK